MTSVKDLRSKYPRLNESYRSSFWRLYGRLLWGLGVLGALCIGLLIWRLADASFRPVSPSPEIKPITLTMRDELPVQFGEIVIRWHKGTIQQWLNGRWVRVKEVR